MSVFKQIIAYFFWTLIAIIIGFCYIRIILGPAQEGPTNFFTFIFNLMYEFVLVRIGLIIGSIIALLFILLDIFYLNKRLKNVKSAPAIRFLIVVFITFCVGAIHYVLEKVVDVI